MVSKLSSLTAHELDSVIILAEKHRASDSESRGRAYSSLHAYVLGLSDDAKDELMALMWLGRGTAGETPEMWDDLVAHARRESEPGKTESIVDKDPLSEYLKAGREAFR